MKGNSLKLAVLDDEELKQMLLEISDKFFDGLWSPRMEDFNRWRPPGVSRANRQLTKRGMGTDKHTWRDLVVQLTGREPKPLARLKPESAVEVQPVEPSLLPYTPYWKREAPLTYSGLMGIPAYRVVGEWCPTTLSYLPVYCEKVILLR